jgi:hypothetical protein
LPDNDDAGRDHAQDVATKLWGIASSIRIVELAGLPPKGDVSNWLASGGTAEELLRLANAAPEWRPEAPPPGSNGFDPEPRDAAEPPHPLMREPSPADPFPVGALGEVLGAAARAIHDKVQAPLAICGQSVLAAATLAVQAHADVELPTEHIRPLSCYFVTVAATGERKTVCDAEALWPIRKREAALRAAHDSAALAHRNAQEAWEAARKSILSKKQMDSTAKREALHRLGPSPTAPLTPMLTCPEPTFEGLCKLQVVGQPSVGVFAAEGGLFIGGHGMSDENKLRTAAGLSSMWDGEPVRRVRAGEGSSVLPGRRVTMHLMAQPEVAATLLSDRLLLDQGLLSRALVSAPATAAGSRLWRDPVPESAAALRRCGAMERGCSTFSRARCRW